MDEDNTIHITRKSLTELLGGLSGSLLGIVMDLDGRLHILEQQASVPDVAPPEQQALDWAEQWRSGFRDGMREGEAIGRHLEQQVSAPADRLTDLLDQLEPAWRQSYDDPLNYVRAVHSAAVHVLSIRPAEAPPERATRRPDAEDMAWARQVVAEGARPLRSDCSSCDAIRLAMAEGYWQPGPNPSQVPPAEPAQTECRAWEGMHKGLRHEAATLMAWAGVHPKTAAALVGHGSEATTMEIYTHVNAENQRAGAEAVEALIRG